MSRVSLYLDVDGVVSPFAVQGRTGWGSEWALADAGVLEVAFAPELVAKLNVLSRRPGARFVWLTTWERLAPEFLCPAIKLDGRDWPVLSSAGRELSPDWWKLDAIRGDVARHPADRLVWLDDQLDNEPRALAWADAWGGRMLHISPDPRKGLTPDHLDAVEAFL